MERVVARQMEYFHDEFKRPASFFAKMTGTTGVSAKAEAVAYYLTTGASAYAFAISEQCRLLYGVDAGDPAFVEGLAQAIADIDFERILETP